MAKDVAAAPAGIARVEANRYPQDALRAGAVLLASVAAVIVWHVGPAFLAGQRVSGTSDLTQIAAFYSDPAMRVFWWIGSFSLLGIVAFAVLFRRYLRSFGPEGFVEAAVDMGAALAVAAVPLYALSAGLESALVQVANAGDAARPGLLGVFAAWDWTYNSLTYFLEAGYMAAWAYAAWRLDALPGWIVAIGALTAVGQLFNSQVLLSGMPDSVTLIPTALFFTWFVSAGVYLVRFGRRKALRAA